jgi:nucleoside-diphosphate-sugar epimerase
MKKVILTGASGFIGRHTIPYLLESGYEVHAIARHSTHLPAGIHIHSIDLHDQTKVSHLLNNLKASHLLHFAWITTPGKYWTSDENLEWVKSSLSLVQEFAMNGGQRLVVSGTCAEYEWRNQACDELTTPLKPSTLYGVCKASLFQLIQAIARQKNLSFAWGRIFFLYGPHEYRERLVPSIVNKLLKQEVAPCSHGMQIRDFLHVEDVARAFSLLLNSDIQGAVNMASGQNISLKQIIDKISLKLEATDKVQYGAISATSDPPLISANNKRLIDELKWAPKFSLDEGLEQTLAWWKQQNAI